MTLDKAKALSLKLKLLLDNWGKEMEIDGGLFYEFTITPEHEIKQLSVTCPLKVVQVEC